MKLPVCFLGETVTAPTDTGEHLRLGAATIVQTLMLGGIGAGIGYALAKPSNRVRYQKNGAITGAVVGGVTGGLLSSLEFCGIFSSKSEQDEIERALRPTRILRVAGGAAAALAGGVLGSMASKAHPAIGATVGAALGSGVAVAAMPKQECPRLT
jgi:uncharacterized protein YcfJ